MSQLILEHHSYFKEIFPNELLLPKHHLLIHYPQCLIKSGPFVRYWCMRFEARHNFFKEIGKVSRNYKNICKTLAKRFQYALACLFMSGQLHPPLESSGQSEEIIVASLPSDIICCIIEALGLCRYDIHKLFIN